MKKNIIVCMMSLFIALSASAGNPLQDICKTLKGTYYTGRTVKSIALSVEWLKSDFNSPAVNFKDNTGTSYGAFMGWEQGFIRRSASVGNGFGVALLTTLQQAYMAASPINICTHDGYVLGVELVNQDLFKLPSNIK